MAIARIAARSYATSLCSSRMGRTSRGHDEFETLTNAQLYSLINRKYAERWGGGNSAEKIRKAFGVEVIKEDCASDA